MSLFKRILNNLPLVVSAGIFHGTRCKLTSTGDGVVAKLAGTYEMEIYPAFAAAIARKPAVVVDIGAAEGFYLAALGRAIPEAKVIGYEAKEEWWPRIKQMLFLNGISPRCEIRGFCDKMEFKRMLSSLGKEKAFILMDIEGGEFELLDDETLPLLKNVEMVVELHEFETRQPGDTLIEKLGKSHVVKVSWSRSARKLEDIKSLYWKILCALLPSVQRRLEEGRVGQMRWLHATPNA